MPRITKKDIYKEFGIEYNGKTEKIFCPGFGWINVPLVNGNDKIGKFVYHFSTLPGSREYNVTVNGQKMRIFGTCAGDCKGCYGMSGNYKRYPDTYNNLGMRTFIAREYTDFLKLAIMAQIKADKIRTIRIHATGDFFSRAYLEMWIDIVKENPAVTFWTYTKETAAENAFNEFKNANIVKSNIPDIGYNYGHCDYIISVCNMLRDMGKTVYICRCGIDKGQHCTNCKACATCEHVLFLEHSTEYNAAKDPRYDELKALIESQGNIYLD